jgi:hypothetical protein
MVCEPTASVEVVKVAVPSVPSGAVPSTVVPSSKVMVTVGAPIDPALGATAAVKVTIWPTVEELEEDLSVVVSADGVTCPWPNANFAMKASLSPPPRVN